MIFCCLVNYLLIDYGNPFTLKSQKMPQSNFLASPGIKNLTSMLVFTMKEKGEFIQRKVVLSALSTKKNVRHDQY